MLRFEKITLGLCLSLAAFVIALTTVKPMHLSSTKYMANFENTRDVSLPTAPIGRSHNHTKDLWTANSKGRLHHHISAPSTHLQIIQEDNRTSCLKETLSHPTLWLEDAREEDKAPSYQMITAKRGEFSLPGRTAECTDVLLTSEENTVKAHASTLLIDFSQALPTFSAEGFSLHKETP